MQTPVIMSAPVNTAGDAAPVKPTITDATPTATAPDGCPIAAMVAFAKDATRHRHFFFRFFKGFTGYIMKKKQERDDQKRAFKDCLDLFKDSGSDDLISHLQELLQKYEVEESEQEKMVKELLTLPAFFPVPARPARAPAPAPAGQRKPIDFPVQPRPATDTPIRESAGFMPPPQGKKPIFDAGASSSVKRMNDYSVPGAGNGTAPQQACQADIGVPQKKHKTTGEVDGQFEDKSATSGDFDEIIKKEF